MSPFSCTIRARHLHRDLGEEEEGVPKVSCEGGTGRKTRRGAWPVMEHPRPDIPSLGSALTSRTGGPVPYLVSEFSWATSGPASNWSYVTWRKSKTRSHCRSC